MTERHERSGAAGVAAGNSRGVFAAALASLPGAGSKRLARLLSEMSASQAWSAVCGGDLSEAVASYQLRSKWRSFANNVDLADIEHSLEVLDVWVTTIGESDHPDRLAEDIDPAPVIFRRGRAVDCEPAAVAIVGTRRCTPTGRSVAVELGSGLAAAGVTVVSGLALGIDGAAHKGALKADGAPVVGVVGSGIDVVYPRGNSALWEQVATRGTLLSEAELGAEPERWRFPARNRLIAALADVVVVVESKRHGGSMHTVAEAIRRGPTVMAVPGSVRNPAAEGTNFLISEGCVPACSTQDVLVALGLATEGRIFGPVQSSSPSSSSQGNDAGPQVELTRAQKQVLAALDDGPVSLDHLVARVALAAPEVLAATEQLEAARLLSREGGRVMRAG